jgi:hypothetical protein
MKYQIQHDSIKDYQPDIEKISLSNIQSLNDHSIESINIYNTIELLDEPNETLKLLLSKLRLKGVVSLIGVDLNKICELYIDKFFNFKEFNGLIKNKTIYPLSEVIKLLVDNNYKVNTVKTDRLLYYIECGRLQSDQN